MRVVPLEIGGETVLVEIEEVTIEAPDPERRRGLERLDDSIDRLHDLGASLTRTCAGLYRAVNAATDPVRPDEIELEFGIKLGGEAGIPFVSKGTAEASIVVTLRWGGGVT